ncbi:Nucleoside diphosphate-linked moiety X motif 13 [Sarracenia purpurea var. burkii]
MASIIARTGRHRQRYENNLRLVSGCIPYRVAKDDKDHNSDRKHKVEVLMISSANRDGLVFPKGGWDDDETLEEAACREALEEAGVKGILNGNPLGVWEFRSKSSEERCSLEGGCKGYMFALEVTEELEIWPEQGVYDRKWVYLKEAFKLCRYEWMRRALEKFKRVLTESMKHEMREEIVEVHHVPVAVAVTECQILSADCYAKPSDALNLNTNTNNNNNNNNIVSPMGDGGSPFWDYASWHIAVVAADSGHGCG